MRVKNSNVGTFYVGTFLVGTFSYFLLNPYIFSAHKAEARGKGDQGTGTGCMHNTYTALFLLPWTAPISE
jgi:hypothetical protein